MPAAHLCGSMFERVVAEGVGHGCAITVSRRPNRVGKAVRKIVCDNKIVAVHLLNDVFQRTAQSQKYSHTNLSRTILLQSEVQIFYVAPTQTVVVVPSEHLLRSPLFSGGQSQRTVYIRHDMSAPSRRAKKFDFSLYVDAWKLQTDEEQQNLVDWVTRIVGTPFQTPRDMVTTARKGVKYLTSGRHIDD